jgi:hypothetical protein
VIHRSAILDADAQRDGIVLRQGLTLFQQEVEAEFEARNIFGIGYKEFQERDGNIVYSNNYEIGTTFAASISVNF